MKCLVLLFLTVFCHLVYSCQHGSVHLTSSYSSILFGVVEVCLNGAWHTICTDFWDNQDASVICRQLGHSPYGAVGPSDVYQHSSVSHHINDLNCTGNETNILDCPYNGLLDYSCPSNNREANVFCKSLTVAVQANCTDGDVRLVGGVTKYEGRVEVCVNRAWGSACAYSGWGYSETNIVCNQIGAMKVGGTYNLAVNFGFEKGSGPILLGHLSCTGKEENLVECRQNYFLNNLQCPGHDYDAGVKCQAPCEDRIVRLRGGPSQSTGRLEVCVNGIWGTVCSDFWDNNDASVVCRQLGYSPYGALAESKYYIEWFWPVRIFDLNCTGNESSIWNCSYNGLLDYDCPDNRDASIICQDISTPMANCRDGDIKLIGGVTDYEGRVQICINKAWGGVCIPGWGGFDSRVVCRQLGHMERGAVAFINTEQFGQGTRPIFLSSVSCYGHESHLINCSFHPFDASVCPLNSLAGVKCEASCENGTLRLYSEIGSYFRRYGRVQLCINNVWGTVCDDFWDDKDASVICRMLGYSPHGASALTGAFVETTWNALINDLNCTGNELSLWDCPHNGLNDYSCGIYDDASVICQLPDVLNEDCKTGDIRLTDGSTQYEGRVEVCFNGVWGAICDSHWTDIEASTTCKTLGYQSYGAAHYSNSHFGPGKKPFHIYNVVCLSHHDSLWDCKINRFPYFYTGCNKYHEVGLKCEPQCVYGEVQIYSGMANRYGNVRVCMNGTWSKVCGRGNSVIDSNFASIVCGQVGYAHYGAMSIIGLWDYNDYPFNIFDVHCNGNETSLLDCHYNTTSFTLCYSYDAVGVFCQKNNTKGPFNCTDGDVKLFGGSKPNKGILHICVNKAWSTVCWRNNWQSVNTAVVCHQLGYTAYGNTYSLGRTDDGYPAIIAGLSCQGTEKTISSCNRAPNVDLQYCSLEVVEIQCQEPCSDGDVRLLEGYYFGRVQVCVAGVWGSICSDSYWDNYDASVICRQLGLSPYGALAIAYSRFYDFDDPTFFEGLNCIGTEKHIFDCPLDKNVATCPYSWQDANIICPVHGSTFSNCTDGEIKLVGGSTEYEGTVQVCLNNAWGTICDRYGFGLEEAQTVCNSLGHATPDAAVYYNAHFGMGPGPILMSNIRCASPQSSLLVCTYSFDYNRYCTHHNDAGVKCTFCKHGDLRLVEGTSPLIGRVEVCYNGVWGTICSDYWDANDASVVCRQLGYPGEGAVARTGMYTEGMKVFNIIDLNCVGTETNIFDCSYNNIFIHNCDHHDDDASVECQAPDTSDNCTNGEIRLVNGLTIYEGRVEICNEGIWGSICPSHWDKKDAMVVCRQLGYPTTGAFASKTFGQGVGPVHFSIFLCSGSESHLLSCRHYTTSCTYSYHAGVHCEAPCQYGNVRLKGDSRYNDSGHVEVCINDTWGTICDDYWDNNDASVVCKQLGFSPYGAIAKTSFYFDYSLPHTMFKTNCSGDETTLLNCSYITQLNFGSNCSASENARVICQVMSVQNDHCSDYDIKLVDGPSANEGKVLICINRVWGTLCSNNINSTDAAVICRQLGYRAEGAILYTSQYSINDVLLVDDITCSGTESQLEQCFIHHYSRGTTLCDVVDIVGVKCHYCNHGDIRINPYNTYTKLMGHVEVCINGSWGSICSDHFDDNDAKVVCRQLGYSPLGAMSMDILNSKSITPINFVDLNCTGNEENILNCSSNLLTNYSCPLSHDAAVACQEVSLTQYANCSNGQLRLSGGSSMLQGRVEICYGNTWFGVCAELFNSYENPKSICRLLGYSEKGYQGNTGSFLDLPLLPLFPYEFSWCPEDSFLKCQMWPIDCQIDHAHHAHVYASVSCQALCKHGDIRLTGSSYDTVGQVYICLNGTWGTICSDGWTENDASVVCRYLGYSPYGATSFPPGIYFSYNNIVPVYISLLNCTGNEFSVLDCYHELATSQTCDHTHDAAVICRYTNNTVDLFCNDGDVRLVDGVNELGGRVEMCYNKFWGSVCHQKWQTGDADIVCKQLHFQPTGSVVYSHSYFGHGVGPNIISTLICSGTENSLLECDNDKYYALFSCGDGSVAGAICLESCSNDEIRRSGSLSAYTGRVDFCAKHIWTSVCNVNWGLKEAQVACREMGLSPYGALPTYDCFIEDQLSFGITNIKCTGFEQRLANCSHNNSAVYDCSTHKDAGVICQAYVQRAHCTDGEVRLVNGDASYEGRVEVCINEAWGTVCSDDWDNTEARIVCIQLGYLPLGGRAKVNAYFGPGTGPILLTNLVCSGNESSLLQCHRHFCEAYPCSHDKDAGVICEPPCTDGDIRLGDGAVLRGRVEVCINGTWGTICDHYWTQQEASVVCSHLGYSSYGAIAASNLFIDYEWPVMISGLFCYGNESRLWDCMYERVTNEQSCSQVNDASVLCANRLTEYSNCSDGDIRLVGGQNHTEGNVQICYNSAWGSVCSNNWETSDSDVVCRELGYQPYGSTYYIDDYFSVANSLFFYGTFSCSGNEKRLIDCFNNGYSSLLTCNDNNVAGVHCEGVCTDGKVRLRGSTNELIGRVEVCVNGTWSTICDQDWDDNDAAVICRQLGHSSYGSMAAYGSLFSEDYPTRVYSVNCIGNESTLFRCFIQLTPKEVSYNQCDNNDAGVICQAKDTSYSNCTNGEVRLADGPTSNQGRVEVCINNVWGTVCDRGWDTLDGNVVCKQLGYQAYGSQPKYWSLYGPGSNSSIMLADLACKGSEDNLLDCDRNTYGVLQCSNDQITGVVCEELCTDLTVRIVGSPFPNMGRVDLCRDRTWHTICSLQSEVFSVICQQLGYSSHGIIGLRDSFPDSTLPSYKGYIDCPQQSRSLSECTFDDVGFILPECESSDYGLICQDSSVAISNCSHGDVRLVGGRTLTEGQVEICIDKVWGAVCDKKWDYVDANIVCSMLGLYPSGAIARYGNFYGQGSSTGAIFMSGLTCTGSELNLLDCSRDIYGAAYCRYYEEAGVKCQGSYPVIPSRTFGSIFGGEVLFISGPNFQPQDKVTCLFGIIEIDGIRLSEKQCLCIVPPASHIGLTDLNIRITRDAAVLSGVTQYRYVSPFMSVVEEPFSIISNEFALGTGESINITWNPNDFTEGLVNTEDVKLDIAIILFDSEAEDWEEETPLASNILNSVGQATVVIPNYSHIDSLTVRLVQFKISTTIIMRNDIPENLATVLSRVTKSVLRYLVKRIDRNTKKRLACERWYEYDNGVISETPLPPCPCTITQMNNDDRYTKETTFQFVVSQVFFQKSKAVSCFRERNVGSYHPSQQCCYDNKGQLLTGIGGGRAYKVYPNNWGSIVGHLRFDVTPFYLCCSGFFKACNRYYSKRPNDDCSEWPDRTARGRVFGDPHMVTLDGYKYTFNGHGEFILLQSLDKSLNIQARMTEPPINNRTTQLLDDEGGTVISAIVAKHEDSDTVQFELIDNKMIALVNGDQVDFTKLSEHEFRNLTVISKDNGTLLAVLATGVTITAIEQVVLLDVTVTISVKYYHKTQGLFGRYNGNKRDDLLPKNSTISLPLNSTIEEIHNNFGLTWIIDDPANSLFTYGLNGGWDTFYRPDYIPLFQVIFQDPELEEMANKVCEFDKYCLFDVAATKDVTIGMITKETEAEQKDKAESFIPTICDPPCIYGACVSNDTCYCSNGYDGEICEIAVYEECEENLCLNGANCVMHAGDYICNCTEGFSGPFCGNGNYTIYPDHTGLIVSSSNSMASDTVSNTSKSLSTTLAFNTDSLSSSTSDMRTTSSNIILSTFSHKESSSALRSMLTFDTISMSSSTSDSNIALSSDVSTSVTMETTNAITFISSLLGSTLTLDSSIISDYINPLTTIIDYTIKDDIHTSFTTFTTSVDTLSSKGSISTFTTPIDTASSKDSITTFTTSVDTLSSKDSISTLTTPIDTASSKDSISTLTTPIDTASSKDSISTLTTSVDTLSSKDSVSTFTTSLDTSSSKDRISTFTTSVDTLSSKGSVSTFTTPIDTSSSKGSVSTFTTPIDTSSSKDNSSTFAILVSTDDKLSTFVSLAVSSTDASIFSIPHSSNISFNSSNILEDVRTDNNILLYIIVGAIGTCLLLVIIFLLIAVVVLRRLNKKYKSVYKINQLGNGVQENVKKEDECIPKQKCDGYNM